MVFKRLATAGISNSNNSVGHTLSLDSPKNFKLAVVVKSYIIKFNYIHKEISFNVFLYICTIFLPINILLFQKFSHNELIYYGFNW